MLWALAALAIPIAVHLFNFRRHKLVYFSNTALLKAIRQENAKTKKLKYLVVLCLRCLFIIGLVLAFAFPYKPDTAMDLNAEEGFVGIYLDNSMSMKAQSSKTTLLEDARKSAKDLVGQLPPSTRYLLLTNSFEVQNEYPMNQEEMLDQLDRMSLDGRPIKMNEVIDRFEMLRKRHGFEQASLFVYSDFQKNMLDLTGISIDTALRIIVVPVQAELQANLSIDTVWLSSPVMQPGLSNELHVIVSNHGEKAVKGLPINLSMDGKVTASSTLDVEGKEQAELVMQFLLQEQGSTRCAVSLMDYPITFDDIFDFVIETRPTLKVVELNGAGKTSNTAMIFGEDPQYDFTLMDPSRIDLNALSKAQLIVVGEASAINETVRQSLFNDAAEGASVAFFHDDGRTVDTSTMSVHDVAVKHDFFGDMILNLPQHADLPKVKRHVRLMPSANATVLMNLDNGDPMLLETPVVKGRVYDFATTLDADWSNLADNSLFVPLMLKMALLGGSVGKMSYTLGDDKTLVFNDLNLEGDGTLELKNDDGSFVMMPAHEVRNNRMIVFLHDDLPDAGFYELAIHDSVYHVMAWNDSRVESEMDFADRETIAKAFKDEGFEATAVLDGNDFASHDLVQAMARQSSIWKWFVLLALIALAGEVAVLRFWK
jgi:hypothetical protein